jgi:hypothetical protein
LGLQLIALDPPPSVKPPALLHIGILFPSHLETLRHTQSNAVANV